MSNPQETQGLNQSSGAGTGHVQMFDPAKFQANPISGPQGEGHPGATDDGNGWDSWNWGNENQWQNQGSGYQAPDMSGYQQNNALNSNSDNVGDGNGWNWDTTSEDHQQTQNQSSGYQATDPNTYQGNDPNSYQAVDPNGYQWNQQQGWNNGQYSENSWQNMDQNQWNMQPGQAGQNQGQGQIDPNQNTSGYAPYSHVDQGSFNQDSVHAGQNLDGSQPMNLHQDSFSNQGALPVGGDSDSGTISTYFGGGDDDVVSENAHAGMVSQSNMSQDAIGALSDQMKDIALDDKPDIPRQDSIPFGMSGVHGDHHGNSPFVNAPHTASPFDSIGQNSQPGSTYGDNEATQNLSHSRQSSQGNVNFMVGSGPPSAAHSRQNSSGQPQMFGTQQNHPVVSGNPAAPPHVHGQQELNPAAALGPNDQQQHPGFVPFYNPAEVGAAAAATKSHEMTTPGSPAARSTATEDSLSSPHAGHIQFFGHERQERPPSVGSNRSTEGSIKSGSSHRGHAHPFQGEFRNSPQLGMTPPHVMSPVAGSGSSKGSSRGTSPTMQELQHMQVKHEPSKLAQGENPYRSRASPRFGGRSQPVSSQGLGSLAESDNETDKNIQPNMPGLFNPDTSQQLKDSSGSQPVDLYNSKSAPQFDGADTTQGSQPQIPGGPNVVEPAAMGSFDEGGQGQWWQKPQDDGQNVKDVQMNQGQEPQSFNADRSFGQITSDGSPYNQQVGAQSAQQFFNPAQNDPQQGNPQRQQGDPRQEQTNSHSAQHLFNPQGMGQGHVNVHDSVDQNQDTASQMFDQPKGPQQQQQQQQQFGQQSAQNYFNPGPQQALASQPSPQQGHQPMPQEYSHPPQNDRPQQPALQPTFDPSVQQGSQQYFNPESQRNDRSQNAGQPDPGAPERMPQTAQQMFNPHHQQRHQQAPQMSPERQEQMSFNPQHPHQLHQPDQHRQASLDQQSPPVSHGNAPRSFPQSFEHAQDKLSTQSPILTSPLTSHPNSPFRPVRSRTKSGSSDVSNASNEFAGKGQVYHPSGPAHPDGQHSLPDVRKSRDSTPADERMQLQKDVAPVDPLRRQHQSQREGTMSPGATLWENPKVTTTGVTLAAAAPPTSQHAPNATQSHQVQGSFNQQGVMLQQNAPLPVSHDLMQPPVVGMNPVPKMPPVSQNDMYQQPNNQSTQQQSSAESLREQPGVPFGQGIQQPPAQQSSYPGYQYPKQDDQQNPAGLQQHEQRAPQPPQQGGPQQPNQQGYPTDPRQSQPKENVQNTQHQENQPMSSRPSYHPPSSRADHQVPSSLPPVSNQPQPSMPPASQASTQNPVPQLQQNQIPGGSNLYQQNQGNPEFQRGNENYRPSLSQGGQSQNDQQRNPPTQVGSSYPPSSQPGPQYQQNQNAPNQPLGQQPYTQQSQPDPRSQAPAGHERTPEGTRPPQPNFDASNMPTPIRGETKTDTQMDVPSTPLRAAPLGNEAHPSPATSTPASRDTLQDRTPDYRDRDPYDDRNYDRSRDDRRYRDDSRYGDDPRYQTPKHRGEPDRRADPNYSDPRDNRHRDQREYDYQRPPSRTQSYRDIDYYGREAQYDRYGYYERPRSRQGSEDDLNVQPEQKTHEERPASRQVREREQDRDYADYYYRRAYERKYSIDYGYDYRDYNRSRYYDDPYYEDYYRRVERYNRGYYDELKSYYGQQQAVQDDRYYDYYRRQSQTGYDQYDRQSQHSRGGTPGPDDQYDRYRAQVPGHAPGSRPSSRQGYPGSRPSSRQDYYDPRDNSFRPEPQRDMLPFIPYRELPSPYYGSQSSSQAGSRPGSRTSYTSYDYEDFLRSYNQYGSRPGSRQSYGHEYGQDPSQAYNQSYNAMYQDAGDGSWPAMQPGVDEPKGRMTPAKFAIPHVCARFGPCGQLIKVLPNRPSDGQPACVEVHEVENMYDSEFSDSDILKSFPGPLIKGETHKNDVLAFCHMKARHCHENVGMVDRESAELIWKYLELLIKQNGTALGCDISDLLLEGHEPTSQEYHRTGIPIHEHSAGATQEGATTVVADRTIVNKVSSVSSVDEITDRFRHLLLYGRKKDALEWASKHHLWGHALFLASKMDSRTHANIMTRFANNSMKMNDPLQTLYQLMSGRQPAAVTCISDKRWGDWRPHIAMVLSNSSNKPDLDRKSIAQLGDTLAAQGCLHGSHFCYLMAQQSFGTYSKKTSKIVLIGSSHNLPFEDFATNEAIQCTEVFEFAQGLGNPLFSLPYFQTYKFIYATRLAECGLSQEALVYTEVISNCISRNPAVYNPVLVRLVYDLGCRLKYSDPQRLHAMDDTGDPHWLLQLQKVCQGFDDGTIQPMSGSVTPGFGSTTTESEAGDSAAYGQEMAQYGVQDASQQGAYNNYNQQMGQQQMMEGQQQQWQGYYQGQDGASLDPNQQYQQQQQWAVDEYGNYYDPNAYAQQQQQMDGQQQWTDMQQQQQYGNDQPDGMDSETGQDVDLKASMNSQYTAATSTSEGTEDRLGESGHGLDYYSASAQQFSSATAPNKQIQAAQAQAIGRIRRDSARSNRSRTSSGTSMGGVESFGGSMNRNSAESPVSQNSQPSSPTRGRFDFPPGSGAQSGIEDKTPSPATPSKPLDGNDTKQKPQQKSGGGIFGSIFNKFSFRGKNQMILPDEKNPPITWDPVSKRWINKDGDEDDAAPVAPPPKDSELKGPVPQASGASAPAPGQAPAPSGGGPPMGNRFSRLKSRGARGQYVDVLNSSKTSAAPAVPSSLFNVMPSASSTAMPANIFIPTAVPTEGGEAGDQAPQPQIANPTSEPTTPIDQQPLPPTANNLMPPQPTEPQQSQPRVSASASDIGPPPASGGVAVPTMFNPAQFTQPQLPAYGSGPGRGPSYRQRRAYPKQ